MKYGTSYFVSLAAAVRYYQGYHSPDTWEAVGRKLREGEIHIGKPSLKPGDRLVLLDEGTRYGIEESAP